MNDADIPTYVELMLPTLQAVDQLGGSASIDELSESVPSIAGLSSDQLSVEYPEGSAKAGTSKIQDRLAWARTYLGKIGALENSRRVIWAISPEGRTYLSMEVDEANERLREEDGRVRRERRAQEVVEVFDSVGVEEAETSDELHDDWKSLLLATLLKMDPIAFERLGMRLLREAGFNNVEVTQRSGDGGIDGTGVYRLSLVSFPTYFQCKRYSGSVGPGVVRDFRGAMAGRGEKGLIISTGVFSAAAREEASRDGAPPIDLVDGDRLCDLLKEFRVGVGVSERVVEEVIVMEDYFSSL